MMYGTNYYMYFGTSIVIGLYTVDSFCLDFHFHSIDFQIGRLNGEEHER